MLDQNPLVSIIVPIYNKEKYIYQCLKSIINQSYTNIEVVIINDGSTDNSMKIVESFCDERIVIINQKNHGLSYSRQKGVECSKGTYFCTIDADDYYDENFVSKMIHALLETAANVCVCNLFNNNNGKQVPLDVCLDNTEHTITINELDEQFEAICSRYMLSDSWNKMYEKKFVLDSKVVFDLPRGLNGVDLMFNHLLFLHAPKVCTLKDRLLIRNKDDNSIVHRKNKCLDKNFEVIYSRLACYANKMNIGPNIKYQIGWLYIKSLRQVILDMKVFGDKEKHRYYRVYSTMKRLLSDNGSIGLRVGEMDNRFCKMIAIALKMHNFALFWIICKVYENTY